MTEAGATFVYTLLGGAVFGLTTLAIKEPAGYRRLLLGINIVAGIIAVFIAGWHSALTTLVTKLGDRLPPLQQRDLLGTVLDLLPSVQIIWICGGLAGYTFFLRYLPMIIKGRDDRGDP